MTTTRRPTSVRLTAEVERALDDQATRSRASRTEMIAVALREWLVQQEHPEITFRPTTTGHRRAALAGGPKVSTIARVWLDHDSTERSPVLVADYLNLPSARVEAALSYWAEHRDEIDRELAEEEAAARVEHAAWLRRQELNAL